MITAEEEVNGGRACLTFIDQMGGICVDKMAAKLLA